MTRRFIARGPAGLSALWLAAACSSGPAPPPEPPALPPVPRIAGVYEGGFEADGQPIDGTLRLEQEGISITGSFESPLGVSAEGAGEIDGEEFLMDLTYVLECPGTARLRGRIREDGRLLTGTFDASDCTGGGSGTFRFERSG